MAAKTTENNYWLAGFTFGDADSQLSRFKTEGIWEARFNEENMSDKRQLEQAKKIKKGDVVILKSTSTKGKKHDKTFLRVKAAGVVSSNIKIESKEGKTSLLCKVQYANMPEKDFEGSPFGSYRNTVHLADNKVQAVIDYVNQFLNQQAMQQQKYKEYIDLLKENYNLVLTGAPGTGKTYMAQQIAKEMGAKTCFVQFHPSYDYTDFVEGLRPVDNDGQMGFERKDGVFKEFCREAIKNLADSEKSVESLSKEMSWQERLEQFVEDAIDNETKFELVNKSKFTISEMKGQTIIAHNEQNEKTIRVAVNAGDILELLNNEVRLTKVRDIRNYFNRKFGTQPDSYAYVIVRDIRKKKQKLPIKTVDKVERKPFVFIIDEINRGEASKIFGELFYAIDPGYRGKTDRNGKERQLVQTQYQNLVPEADVFAKGFYVPENVYILATMNDIDRSVESMDFAMRRRFTWREVTPEDTSAMLDVLDCAEQAKQTMNRLNQAIAETDGLGAAYMVGPSYFLRLKDNGDDFNKLWRLNIEPLLREYLRGFRKADALLAKFQKAYFEADGQALSEELTDED